MLDPDTRYTLIEGIDFPKIHAIMEFLDWKTLGNKSEWSVPAVEELEDIVIELLIRIDSHPISWFVPGYTIVEKLVGFTVSKQMTHFGSCYYAVLWSPVESWEEVKIMEDE